MGVMGGGVALAIRQKYPKVYQEYHNVCQHALRKALLGECLVVQVSDTRSVANLFGQFDCDVSSPQTNYDALHRSLSILQNHMAAKGLYSVALPAGIGCGLAGGDWDVVQGVVSDIFSYTVMSVVYYDIEDRWPLNPGIEAHV
jgi:O-acetyl-ADP-ribose deacetylase (regulator of RNase III)